MCNTQKNSMTASYFYMISTATRNTKHLYYQVIHNTCLIFTCNSLAWFCSGIPVLLPLALTQSWCSSASTAFPLQEWEGGETAPGGDSTFSTSSLSSHSHHRFPSLGSLPACTGFMHDIKLFFFFLFFPLV